MLIKLYFIRLFPMILLWKCKDIKKLRALLLVLLVGYGCCFATVGWELFCREHWMFLGYLIIAMFPQYLCYGFSMWLLMRCVWNPWSWRVWRRIFRISLIITVIGIYAEYYVNTWVLELFF